MQNKKLTEFYQAYAAWLDEIERTGRRCHEYFTTHQGLCANLAHFGNHQHIHWREVDKLAKEMANQFEVARLDRCYPFNYGDEDMYSRETAHNLATGNPQRIQWVRDHAK